jgi:hypothetical protein
VLSLTAIDRSPPNLPLPFEFLNGSQMDKVESKDVFVLLVYASFCFGQVRAAKWN